MSRTKISIFRCMFVSAKLDRYNSIFGNMVKKKEQAVKKKQQKSISLQADAELEAVRVRVLRRREYLDLLETELTNTRAIIREFTQLYNQRVAPLEREQKRLSQLLEKWAVDLAPPANGWHGRGKRTQKQASP